MNKMEKEQIKFRKEIYEIYGEKYAPMPRERTDAISLEEADNLAGEAYVRALQIKDDCY